MFQENLDLVTLSMLSGQPDKWLFIYWQIRLLSSVMRDYCCYFQIQFCCVNHIIILGISSLPFLRNIVLNNNCFSSLNNKFVGSLNILMCLLSVEVSEFPTKTFLSWARQEVRLGNSV